MDNLLNGIGTLTGVIGGADGPTEIILAGKLGQVSIVVSIAIGLLLCFLGLKIMRALVALAGFVVGAGIGIGITQAAGLSGITNVLVIFGCAVLLTVLSYFVYRLGIFITAFIMVASIVLVIIDTSMNLWLLIALVVTLLLAVLAMIFMEPAVIIITALAGGFFAGTGIVALAGFSGSTVIGYGIGLALAVIGSLVQFMVHSRKVGKKEKMYSRKVKEKDSMESEVEKARMLLDDDPDGENDMEESDEMDDIEIIGEDLE